MKDKRFYTSQKSIVIIFLRRIAVPLILLVLLFAYGLPSLSGMFQDEAKTKNQKITNVVFNTADSVLSAWHQQLSSMILQKDDLTDQQFCSKINSFTSLHPAISEIFICENDSTVSLPSAQLFLETSSSFPETSHNSRAKKILSEALTLVKNGALHPAIQKYQELKILAGDQHSVNGFPYGLAAGMGIGKLFLLTRDTTRAIENYLGLYENLLDGHWVMEESKHDLFASMLTDSLVHLISGSKLQNMNDGFKQRFEQLKQNESRQRAASENKVKFRKAVLEAIPNIKQRASKDHLKSYAVSKISGGWIIADISDEVNPQNISGAWGMWLADSAYTHQFLTGIIRKTIKDDWYGWNIKDKQNNIIVHSKPAGYSFFAETTEFPDSIYAGSMEMFYQRLQFSGFWGENALAYGVTFVAVFIALAGWIGSSLRRMYNEWEMAEKNTNMVAAVSHELKSPLTSIKQITEMLQDERVPEKDRQKRYYDILAGQTNRLNMMIDNILDFARLDENRKQFEFAPLNIAELLFSVLQKSREQVEHLGFTIGMKINNNLPLINADKTALTLAIQNLIDNAIKFSGESKRIVVRCSYTKNHVVIEIQDFGMGIPRKELAHIYERFYRGKSAQKKSIRGTGLGLAMVRIIVESHRGKIDVQSVPEKGTTFVIQLPVIKKENDHAES